MDQKANGSKKKFGAFGGVFVPNLLTILGVIMYLRLGWIVGNAGLFHAVIILIIAQSVTFFTALSMSSIVTNLRMKGGGAYYLVSRSLGTEAGGSIGIPLYIAQTLGIGLYIAGFAESVSTLFPHVNIKLISVLVLITITALSLISTRLVIKTQYVILSLIVLSLVSVFFGKAVIPDHIHLNPQYSENHDFWTVFAIFFPAVTGILAGISMSGDLQKPAKSIPLGTILSVITSFIVYLGLIIWLARAVPADILIENKSILIDISQWKFLVIGGIWGATLSSALASLLAAPRTLEALGKDKVIFSFLAYMTHEHKRMIITTLITSVFTLGILLIGDIDFIAPILTMFFLITYGTINFIAGLEKVVARPSYRPTFNVHWIISFVGAIAILVVMFVINVWACISGFVSVLIIYILLKKKQLKNDWGDIGRGLWFSVISYALEKLERTAEHPKNWKPNILMYFEYDKIPYRMMHLAHDLVGNRGVITTVAVVKPEHLDNEAVDLGLSQLKEYIKKEKFPAFTHLLATAKTDLAQMITTQIHGVGSFKPNTIMMEWADTKKRWLIGSSDMGNQMKNISFYRKLNKSLILYNFNNKVKHKIENKIIDIWWDPSQENGSFMLLLGFLVSKSRPWEGAKVRLNSVVPHERLGKNRELLTNLVISSRIRATVRVFSPEEQIDIVDFDLRKGKGFYNNTMKKINGLRNMTNGVNNTHKHDDMQDNISKLHNKNPDKPGNDLENSGELSDDEQEDHPEEIIEKISEKVDEKDSEKIEKTYRSIIVQNSREADLVILGFNVPRPSRAESYVKKMDKLIHELPPVMMVNCPFDVDLFG